MARVFVQGRGGGLQPLRAQLGEHARHRLAGAVCDRHHALAIPTRGAVDGLDAITWRGLGLHAALAPIVVLLAFSAGIAALAIWRF